MHAPSSKHEYSKAQGVLEAAAKCQLPDTIPLVEQSVMLHARQCIPVMLKLRYSFAGLKAWAVHLPTEATSCLRA